MARLVVEQGKAPTPVRHLGEFPCVVGRLASCGLQLDEPQSSRKHFRVERRGAGYVLVDLGSTNGTYLNHDRVRGEAPLRHDDRIRVGDTVVAFHSAPEPLSPGTRVGTVEVVAARGRSESGGLYLGRQGALDREVLLEVVDPDLAQDPDFRRAYEARARQAGALEHAAVQAVFDTASDRESLYTVFEACPGQPLARRLEAGPAFDRQAALGVVRDLAQALAHVHARRQVHGLLSPAAVVLDGARVKLTCLGEPPGARLRKHRRDAPLQARYASSEEARGEPPTARSDVYSLGALAHHLLVGRPPYEGDDAGDVLEQHAGAAPVALPPGLEPAVAGLLSAMLHKSPDARPDAAEVERRLGDLLDRRKGAADSARRREERPAAEAPRRDSGRREGGPRRADSGIAPRLAGRAPPPPPTFVPLRLLLLAAGYGLIVLASGLATRIALRFL
ncbi:MAG: FHA domain-containing protein [Planctomycetes bacterium]|nr:FHA domain-containing protein [Planctomycetota bacterium]